jgi:eukaryotic-like serine/threonine-protein kinase
MLRELKAKLGPEHPDTLHTQANLGVNYVDAGRMSEAIALLEPALRLTEAKLGPEHSDTLFPRESLAGAYLRAGRTAEAIRLFEAVLRLRESAVGPEHPETLGTRMLLADAHESLGRLAEGERLRRDALSRRRKAETPDSPELAGDLAGLGSNLLKQAKWQEAEPLLRECLAIRAKAIPDDWRRYSAMSLLGGALTGQGKYGEAEPLVLQAYDGEKAREAKIPAEAKPRLLEAAERVVGLYEAWGKPDKATEWKNKLRPGRPARRRLCTALTRAAGALAGSERCPSACGRSWSTTSHWRRRSRSRHGVPRTSSRRWPTARESPRT